MQNQSTPNAPSSLFPSIGKELFRAGGKEMTNRLIEQLAINPEDEVVDFTPSRGYSTFSIIQKQPKAYIGVESNKLAGCKLNRQILNERNGVVMGNSMQSGLSENKFHKVIEEANLSFHDHSYQTQAIQEANRILRTGGWYGLHELALNEDVDQATRSQIEKALQDLLGEPIQLNTVEEWRKQLEDAGFKLLSIESTSQNAFSFRGLAKDEGWIPTIELLWQSMKQRKNRNQIMKLRRLFKQHKKAFKAVTLVVEKKGDFQRIQLPGRKGATKTA